MKGVVVVLAALVLAPAAHAGGPFMQVGAAEDSPKQATLVGAKAKMTMAQLAGLKTIRLTALWRPGLEAPAPAEREALENAAEAGRLAGIGSVVSVYPFGSSVTPLTPAARAEFAAFSAAVARLGFTQLIVGNEPNLNRFWLPQFAPGRARLAMSPVPTGSRMPIMTMGIVSVAFLAAVAPCVPCDTMRSTLSRTSSAAKSGSRSTRPSAYR